MEKSRCFFVKTANMAFKYFLLLAFFFISAHGTSEQFACNAQDVIFIFDTKTSPRSLDDWRALAGDFLDKFNMRADGTSIYARFAAIQFGWDTAHPSTSWYTSPFPSQDNASIVFRFDDYYARSDVKRVIDANVDENLAPNTAIGGALVDATNIFTNQLQNNRTPVIILFTNGLAGETDQSEALSQASILRGLLQVDIWVVLAQDVTSSPDYFGLQLTGNKTNQLFNSTSDAYSTDGIFSAFGKKYPCATPTSPPVTEVCPCTINKSWNDVMILADGSDNMGNDRFTQMWGFIVSALGEATIGQQIAYQTRVGVVVYGNNGHANFLQSYWKKEKEPVRNMLKTIKKECRKLDKIEFNIFYVSVGVKEKNASSETNGEFGNLEIPLLQLSKSKKVLDLSDPGTIYPSFEHYLKNNKLERSVIVYPEEATYAQQQVQLKVCESPSCTLTSDIANVVNQVFNIVSVAAMLWTPGCLLAGRALATMSARIFTQGSFWAVALLRASVAVNSATKYARAITTITSLFGGAFAGINSNSI
ncbi:unnamed protein product, partial [Mesorhabditis belari]|uniref:VWFA domain-containing protein n=1 Tax=Mesorhabditis belari TaxID=2138241 RepID=A0AAF3J8E9_9BILA